MTFHKQTNEASVFRDGYERDRKVFSRASTDTYHTGYLLGGAGSGRDYYGSIAEVIVYDRALSSNEISTVHAYLSNKFNIHIASSSKITSADSRFFHNGILMKDSEYADQPYIIKRVSNSNQWMAVVTYSDTSEAGSDRRLGILSSTNAGATWSQLGVPETSSRMPSWGTLLQTPSGRVYCFYNLNRMDGLGVEYDYCYTDNWGENWSPRYTLPVRETWHEETYNQYKFWGIDPPEVVGDAVYIAFTKKNALSVDMPGEGFVFKSTNILTVANAADIAWEMLPEGDHGIAGSTNIFGPVQEEFNIESLGGDDLYCAFRTMVGYIGESYSTNGGTNWSDPNFILDVTGREIKNPRACSMVWRCENGNYLLWSHNNDGRQVAIRNKDRSVAWLRGGIYENGSIFWSQPEPVLFACAPINYIGMSYPDLTEYNGHYYISATDKEQARLCEISTNLLENLWNQSSLHQIPSEGLIYDSSTANTLAPVTFDVADNGFTVTCAGNLSDLSWSALDIGNNGAFVSRDPDTGKVSIALKDHHMAEYWTWETDDAVATDSTVSFIVDGAANWVYVVVDGELCDGGTNRQYGFGPLPYQMAALTAAPITNFTSEAGRVLVHDRALSVSETIGMHNAITALKSLVASDSFSTGNGSDYTSNINLGDALNSTNLTGTTGFTAAYAWYPSTSAIRPLSGAGLTHVAVQGNTSDGVLKMTTVNQSGAARNSRRQLASTPSGSTYYISGLVSLNGSLSNMDNNEYVCMGLGGNTTNNVFDISTGMYLGLSRNGSGNVYLTAFAGGNAYTLGSALTSEQAAQTQIIVLKLQFDTGAGGLDTLTAWTGQAGQTTLSHTLHVTDINAGTASNLARFIVQNQNGADTSSDTVYLDEFRCGASLWSVTSGDIP